MMKQLFKPILLPLLIMLVGCSDLHITDQHVKPADIQHTDVQLDDEIHQLLKQEMQAIKNGMMSLVPAIASGDWEQVSKIGKKIESSYLLKQKLSIEQRHALHSSLPAGFIKQDQAFHHSAGMLAHAAEMGHADIVNFYFYKLNVACVECHSEYATHHFPNLAVNKDEAHHH